MTSTTATVNVPHAGVGTHTLVVAVEVPDTALADPRCHPAILGAVRNRAAAVLDAHLAPAPPRAPSPLEVARTCRWCPTPPATDRSDACPTHWPLYVGCRRHPKATASCDACRSTVHRHILQEAS